MRKLYLILVLFLLGQSFAFSQASIVETVKDAQGWKLRVDQEDFAIKGVVWSYTPIGQNYTYDLWSQSDEFIQRMLDTDMTLLSKMGVNAIRCFTTIPPQWIEYIYDRYGIYSIVNDMLGRYGVAVGGKWQFPTDYSNPETRKALLEQARKTVETFKDTRGVLLYMFGNESNYGLEWTSTAIENLPSGARLEAKARSLYSLFEEAIKLGKSIDKTKPFGFVNGDIQYLNVIAQEVKSLDLIGINSYRGKNSFDFFYQSIATSLDKPLVYTEMGADAYNVAKEQEDQLNQALMLKEQWKEIYQQAYGKGKSANCLGGFVFEWVDEWYKHLLEKDLDVHDTEGTWNNGGYEFDAVAGKNNMNEEWFGIAAQSKTTENGIHRRLPRTAYYLLQKIFELNMYTSTSSQIEDAFSKFDVALASIQGETNALRDGSTDPAPAWTVSGSLTSRAYENVTDVDWNKSSTAGFKSATQTTATLSVQARPAENLRTGVTFRLVPTPANQTIDLVEPVESATNATSSKFEVYDAFVNFRSPALDIDAFYHTGHPDWVLEGDFFGLMPETFDLYSQDKAGAKAPFGVELSFRESLDGLKIYAGQEVYWGAKPQVTAKYFRESETFAFGWIHQEEIAPAVLVSNNVSKGVDRWTSVYAAIDVLPVFELEAGAMLAKPGRVASADHTFTKNTATSSNSYKIETGAQFGWLDAVAGKVRLTTELLPFLKLGGQYLYAGALADTQAGTPRNGSQLADIGFGNRQEYLGTLDAVYGDFTFASKFLARFPIYDPLVNAGFSPRSAMTDEFFVWNNRKTYQAEAVLTYDTTGASYFHDWNSDDRETSPFTASVSFLYNFYQGPTDIQKFLGADEVSWFAFSSNLPAVSGTWSAQARAVSKLFGDLRIAASAHAGQEQSTGGDSRIVAYWGAQTKIAYQNLLLEGTYLANEWGPAKWYREQNITYPVQWSVGLAYAFKPISFLSETDRVGVTVRGRQYDKYATIGDTGGSGSTPGPIKSRFSLELYFGTTF